jgi:hypothetical protein
MHICRVILLLALGIVSISCRSTDPEERYRAWLSDNFKREASYHKREASYHKHVVLVCIYESHFQWMQLPHKHQLDCKGTVVRSYKGTWQVGEQITLHSEIESAPKDWKPSVGYLEYFLLDKHTTDPICVDVGEDWDYSPNFERELQLIYSKK